MWGFSMGLYSWYSGSKSDVKGYQIYFYSKDREKAEKVCKGQPTSGHSKPVINRKTVRSITAIKRYKESKRK